MINHDRRTRFLPCIAFTIIAMLVHGCSRTTEPSTRDRLIGTWQNTVDGKKNVITFHSDGTFGGKWETGSWGIFTPTVILMSGNWTLDGETVKYTITKSSYNNAEVSGQIAADTIMSINDTTVVFRDEISGGVISTWIRQR